MSRQHQEDIFGEWRDAVAFIVDHRVCSVFSLPSPDDLGDAEAAEAEGRRPDFDPGAAFYVYGEQGLKREYFVDRKMIEGAEHYNNGCKVVYGDGKPLAIEPLFKPGGKGAMGKRYTMVCDDCGSANVLVDAYAQWDIEKQDWEVANTFDKGGFCPDCDCDASIEAVKINGDNLNL